MVVRPAVASDAADAARIIGDALAEHGLSFEPEGRDADVATFGAKPEHDDLVAEIGDRPIGVGSVGPHGDPGVAWISKLFVERDARGRGVGRALLEALHAAARARGYASVGLRTRVVFREAVALYESAGYVRRADPAPLAPGDVVYFRAL
ncbi:MAG: GNAT family N-acetyltransferase [Labilithrix sp.]|nr:GNAT family N-acetyltransferase [Labilithrix sp.]